jgi:hypothetical protein
LYCFHGNVKEKELLKVTVLKKILPPSWPNFICIFFVLRPNFRPAGNTTLPWLALLIRRLQRTSPRKPYGEIFYLHIFCSAAELSASWQHNTALAGAADQKTPKNQSKKTLRGCKSKTLLATNIGKKKNYNACEHC